MQYQKSFFLVGRNKQNKQKSVFLSFQLFFSFSPSSLECMINIYSIFLFLTFTQNRYFIVI